MEAKFTRGPYQRKGRHVETAAWSANVHPFCKAVDTAELEAVATLFQASPLLYEVAAALDKWSRTANPMRLVQELDPIIEQCRHALRAARGEE